MKIELGNNYDEVIVDGIVKKEKDLTFVEQLYFESYAYSLIEGDLHLKDNIKCSICNNKGKIMLVRKDEKGTYIKDCSCVKTRNTYNVLFEKCKFTRETLEQYSFKNFIVENNLQNNLKLKAIDFLNGALNKEKFWFTIVGQSGGGKSHICTAIFRNLISKAGNLDGEYFLWNEKVPKIIALEKSTYTSSQEKYDLELEYLQNVDVLYIDDFLKLTNGYKMNDNLSLAFKILDSRYRNKKITIISSEYLKNEIDSLDTAIYGRINQMCNKGTYFLEIPRNNENNYRKRENKENNNL